MNIDDKLEALKSIKQVEEPPFLLTRIKQQIENLYEVEVPVRWKWAFASTAILIIALNITLLVSPEEKTIDNNVTEVVTAMQMTSSNSLYND